MGEQMPPFSSWIRREIPSFLWRVFASPQMATLLLSLLALAAVFALLFSPQHPAFSAGADELARWSSEARNRFGPWYDTLLALGVLNIGAAAWFRLLLGASSLSLAVTLADRMARVVRSWREPQIRRTESFFRDASRSEEWKVPQKRAALLESLAQRLTWPAWMPWRRLQIRPRREEAGQVSYLYQDWLTIRRAASLLVHWGLLLVLLGAALNARLGWRQQDLMLMPGKSASLPKMPGFSLRLESMDGVGLGETVSWVALDGADGISSAGAVSWGQPYTAHGVSIYLRDVGPILRLSARGAGEAGAPIALIGVSAGSEPVDEIRLLFSESRAERYVLMPYIQKAVRLVLYRRGSRWDSRLDELQLEIYAQSMDAPQAAASIVGSGMVELEGIVYEFAWEQYAVLDVHRSSCQWLVRIGMALALLGLAVTLFIPRARLWVRVMEEKETSVVELAGEMPGEPEALEAWLASWRGRLGGRQLR